MAKRDVHSEETVAEYFNDLAEGFEEKIYGYMRDLRTAMIRRELIGRDILDVGCNCGELIEGYRSDQNVVGIDIAVKSLEYAIRTVDADFVAASARRLPFRDSCFDSIVCSETLYYLDRPDHFIKNALDRLRPGGKLIVVFSNQLYTGLGRRIGPLLGIAIKDIHKGTFYPQEVLRLFRNENFKDISHKGFAVFPMKGMEFFDIFFPKLLGFDHIVTGTK